MPNLLKYILLRAGVKEKAVIGISVSLFFFAGIYLITSVLRSLKEFWEKSEGGWIILNVAICITFTLVVAIYFRSNLLKLLKNNGPTKRKPEVRSPVERARDFDAKIRNGAKVAALEKRGQKRITFYGMAGTGKSTLIRQLQSCNANLTEQYKFDEAQSLGSDDLQNEEIINQFSTDTDTAVFLTTKDLTKSEVTSIEFLIKANSDIIVALNKIDILKESDRIKIQAEITQKLNGKIANQKLVSIASEPLDFFIAEDSDPNKRVKPKPNIGALVKLLNTSH